MRQVFHLILCAVYGIAPVSMALLFAPIDSFIEWVTIGILLLIALAFWYQVIERDYYYWKQWVKAIKRQTELKFYHSFQLLPNVQLLREKFTTYHTYHLMLSLPLYGVVMIAWERNRVTVKG
jgi:hypothetical protein